MSKFKENMKRLLPIMEQAKADGFTLWHGYVWEHTEPWEPAGRQICKVEDYQSWKEGTGYVVREFMNGFTRESFFAVEKEALEAYYGSKRDHVELYRMEGGRKKRMLGRSGRIEIANVI